MSRYIGWSRKFAFGTATTALMIGANFSAVSAQDADTEAETAIEEVVVTGSRIRRDSFSSTTPIQVLSAENSRKLGITSLTEMLQKSTAASGGQIDATLNTNAGNSNATEAPPTGGVGSSNINLRGLGAERTLVLVNGRRLGVAGVRGAPAQPDINMLPLSMVEGADILTGGLSSIYGADAVAGVVNVRLKRDFEGIDISSSLEITEHGGGQQFQTSMVAGVSNDRGNITFGAEYFKRDRVSTGERDFSDCLRNIRVSDAGNEFSACRSGFFDNVAAIGNEEVPGGADGTVTSSSGGIPLGGLETVFFFYTPGQSDINVENWSSGYNLPDVGNGVVAGFPSANRPTNATWRRYAYNDYYNDQDDRRASDLIRPQERFSFVSNGHMELDWGNNEELYFEAYYFNRSNDVVGAKEQIFPTILGQIPLLDEAGNVQVDGDGNTITTDNPLNPFQVNIAPILTLDDINQDFAVEVQQTRFVTGIKGDFGDTGWNWDATVSYDRGTGFQSQTVLSEDRLIETTQRLFMNADGSLGCGLPVQDDAGGFLTVTECVPVDFFASSIYTDGEGRFATDAERNYLLGTRTNRTVTQMWNASAYVTGDMFDISGGGTVGAAFGAEWRKDKISSQNSFIGTGGGNAAENPLTEGETIGERWIWDIYGEVSVPLVVGADWAELLQIDLSGRYTKEENFGDQFTYRIGGLYRPVDYLSFGVSYNTSFRAPNLREQFLADQTGGIGGGNDPCHNQNALQLDPTNPADAIILGNCASAGVDVTVLGTAGTTTIQTSTGGQIDLVAEESTSWTGTMTFSQPWTDRFDFDIAVTYYDISITDTVRELDATTIINRCYGDEPNLGSPFCDRISRNTTSNPSGQLINFVRSGFINVGLETARGLDFTTRLRAEFEGVGEDTLFLTWNTGITRVLERQLILFPGEEAIDNVGRLGNPKWVGQSTTSFSYGNWDFLWQLRYIGETNGAADLLADTVFTDPILFLDYSTAELTTPKRTAEAKWYNDISLTRNFEGFTLTAGMNNVFDVKPPLIDGGAGPNRNNAVTSSGYDLYGRSFFMNASFRF